MWRKNKLEALSILVKWCFMFLSISGKKSELVVSDVEGVGAEDEGEDRVEIENIEGDY